MSAYDFDLLILAGRVFCADSGLDGPGDVRFDYNAPHRTTKIHQLHQPNLDDVTTA